MMDKIEILGFELESKQEELISTKDEISRLKEDLNELQLEKIVLEENLTFSEEKNKSSKCWQKLHKTY